MDNFEGHAKLEYLNLGSNKISDLNLIKVMPNLKKLILVAIPPYTFLISLVWKQDQNIWGINWPRKPWISGPIH